MWFINNKNLFFTVLNTRKHKMNTLAYLECEEDQWSDSQMGVFHCVLNWDQEIRELSLVSFIRVSVPFMGSLSHGSIICRRLQTASTWRLGFQCMNFEGQKHSVNRILLYFMHILCTFTHLFFNFNFLFFECQTYTNRMCSHELI